MDELIKKHHIEELLLALLPCWNNQITRPFKQYLDGGVSLEMYYCLQTLRSFGDMVTMSELAQWMRIPKSQMTKLVNRLFEQGFVERTVDLADRRIIHITATNKAVEYINSFLENMSCFDGLLADMEESDQLVFEEALEKIAQVLFKLSSWDDSEP